MELQVGVKIVLQNEEGKYLVLKRSKEKYPDVLDPWDIIGGRINPGTPLLENLSREVMEETGMTLDGTPRVVAAQDILRGNGRHVVRVTYVGQATGDVRLDSDHTDYRWCTRAELEQLGDALDQYFRAVLATL